MNSIGKSSVSIVKYFSVILLLLVIISPVYWIFVSSLKPTPELLQVPPTLIPRSLTLEHYYELLKDTNFITYFLNSIYVAMGSSLLVVILTSLAGYSVYRCRYKGRHLFFCMLLAIYIFPRVLLLLSLYPLFAGMALVDNLLSLVITYVGITAPLNVWIMRAFFTSVPTELEDAALVDGASRIQILFKIFFPLAAPGIAAVAINSFLMSYAEYLFASILIVSDQYKTLPVGMAQFLQQYEINWGAIAAGSVLIIIPPLIGFAFVGRYFIKGITAGAIR